MYVLGAVFDPDTVAMKWELAAAIPLTTAYKTMQGSQVPAVETNPSSSNPYRNNLWWKSPRDLRALVDLLDKQTADSHHSVYTDLQCKLSWSANTVGRVRNFSDNNKGKALASCCLIHGEVCASLHQQKPYLCWPSVCLKGQRPLHAALGAPPGTDGCVSYNVDFRHLTFSTGALQLWKFQVSEPSEGGMQRKKTGWLIKEGKQEKRQLPGIQSHSSPCRSLVVWGRHALSARSSLLLCLKTN